MADLMGVQRCLPSSNKPKYAHDHKKATEVRKHTAVVEKRQQASDFPRTRYPKSDGDRIIYGALECPQNAYAEHGCRNGLGWWIPRGRYPQKECGVAGRQDVRKTKTPPA